MSGDWPWVTPKDIEDAMSAALAKRDTKLAAANARVAELEARVGRLRYALVEADAVIEGDRGPRLDDTTLDTDWGLQPGDLGEGVDGDK